MTGSRRPAFGEEGLSLVEVIVTVAIMGIVFVAVLGGMWTAIVTSDTHRKQALGTTYLVNAAEHLKSETTTPYARCGSYDLSGLATTSVPAEWKSAMTVSVEYFTFDMSSTPPAQHFSGAAADCLAARSHYDLQQVTITAASPTDGRATEKLTFVKRPE